MRLLVQRNMTVGKATIGALSIDGVSFCDTLEDALREKAGVPVKEWKIPGETAITAGVYNLSVGNSPRFGLDTLMVQQVPGFSEIRIHGGNRAVDTLGCLLVGYKTSPEFISWSQLALKKLKAIVVPAIKRGESVQIEYRNPKEYV